ncbi:MAG: hypothetical protein AAF989_06090 [Planctomycetota bacterium]
MHTDRRGDNLPSAVGHRWIRRAATLGASFVVAHLITVVITCAFRGFNWGMNAWILDIGGFLAGIFFTVQCWLSSKSSAREFRRGNLGIAIWAIATVLFRVVDTLMLFGIVKWDMIYVTPSGLVFWSNVISEAIIGMAFAMTALFGSVKLLLAARQPPK